MPLTVARSVPDNLAVHSLGRGERLLPAPVDPLPLRQGDPFQLPLPDQRPLKLRKGPHHREHEGGHRRVLAGEDQPFLHELHPHSVPGEGLDQAAQIIQVPGEPVHAVDHHGVPLPGKGEEPLQFRTLGIFPGEAVGKGPGDFDGL